MLSQPTTTTTAPAMSSGGGRDRGPIRRVSTWDRKHEGVGGFGFEFGMDSGNDDPEYDGGFGNQLVRYCPPYFMSH